MARSLSKHVQRLEKPHTQRKRKNKSEFLRHVNVIDFLENLDVRNISQATSDEVQFSCPFPGHTHGDDDASAYMNDGSKEPRLTTVWKCHGCGRAGNGITFLSEHEQISRTKAHRELKELYAPGFNRPKDGIGAEFEKQWAKHKAESDQSEVILIDWKKYDRFRVDWEHYGNGPGYEDFDDVQYMLRRGFSPGQLEEWGIGYDDWSERITIPVCDPDGNLVGVKGRAWDPTVKPKYRILGDKENARFKRYKFAPYEKSLVVFGIDKWGEVETYVLVEGEIDVMSLWAMGIPAVCTGSTHVSDVQAKIIREYCNEVVMFFDFGKAGSRGVWGFYGEDGEFHPGAVDKLEPYIRVRITDRHWFDANDYLCRGNTQRVRQLVKNARPSFIARRELAV